jgi:hypothetical protein
MKKIVSMFLLMGFASQICGADLIETKNDKKYQGKIVKTVDGKVVIKTTEGNMIGIPRSNLSKITRGKEVFDFVNGERYYLEIRRPFLPFSVVSVAMGAYSVIKFQDYQKKHADYEKHKNDDGAQGAINLTDTSKKDLGTGLVLAVCSVGTFIMAMRPMEVKVPIGKISLSMNTNGAGVGLAVNF